MKYLFTILSIVLVFAGCESSKTTIDPNKKNIGVTNDTIKITNDSLEYEIIIIEPGFQGFLATQPPRGYYGLTFLENKNRLFVTEYNNRAMFPLQFDFNLYPQTIDYEIGVKYGYEVNYMLYNYFIYFQQKYRQNFIRGRN